MGRGYDCLQSYQMTATKKRPGAKCNYCNQQWARGKSSDMISHIAISCTKPPPPEVRARYYEILRHGEDSDEEGFIEITEPPKKRQTKITEHAEKLTISDDKQDRCIRALGKFFICCGIPFWIVENPFFINFIKNYIYFFFKNFIVCKYLLYI